MKITDLWSLHFENFLIQIEGTAIEAEELKKNLTELCPTKNFFISRVKGGEK